MNMVKPLADIPKGKSVFVDANIFHFYLRGPSSLQKACILLLERIERKDIGGYTSTLVLDELIYKILLKKIEEKHKKNPLTVLQKTPKEIGVHAPEIRRAVDIVLGIEALTVLPVERHHVEEAIESMQRYSMLPRDAIHLSVMKTLDCNDLVSADSDFDRVADLNRWSPL
ncbi:MAG: type II toxin-antitoxin system VapC family toxin [Thaumarchaeota archaeon]|nr:type II toxin-antitoxin system VapC family toxin [Nitrososphaerota archaeon]